MKAQSPPSTEPQQKTPDTAEHQRLAASDNRKAHWKRWGPYLSERAWGTVREDYSPHGTAWEYVPHDHSRSRAYRWNEDGIAGICDRHQRICFALALWNGRDPILKERLFGLTGNEGNHGEDVKECYYYLDSTPTHSYMKCLYKYPQAEFPYAHLIEENRRRGRDVGEFELEDTGVFAQSRYFDVFTEYAKATSEDILIRITVANRGPEEAFICVLPTVWFRNTWSWGHEVKRPWLRRLAGSPNTIELNEPQYGKRWIMFDHPPQLLFTENETNSGRLFGPQPDPLCKDAINDYIVNDNTDAVNSAQLGTKASAVYRFHVPAGGEVVVRARLTDSTPSLVAPFEFDEDFDAAFDKRIREADEFYATVIPEALSSDAKNVMRQSLAGMMWSKQFYHYVVRDWLHGDPGGPRPPYRFHAIAGGAFRIRRGFRRRLR